MPRVLLMIIPVVLLGGVEVARATVGTDVVSSLYANRFSFDRRGVPLIPVRVMEGQSRVTVFARKGVQLLPYGSGATQITGSQSWAVTLTGSRPARVRYWVVLERRRGAATAARRRRVVRRWHKRGLKVQTLEVGTVFAVGGRVVDHRTTLVVTQATTTAPLARRAAQRVGNRFKVRTTLHRELLRRPRGFLTVTPGRGRLRLTNPEVVWFAPVAGQRLTVRQVEFGRGYKWHGRQDRRYFGRIVVTVDRNGRLAVINEVPADHLLFGLVPAETFVKAPMEALKAQAVAARGQLLAKIGMRHTLDPYLICSAQHCQVYSGVGSEHPRTTRAVRETRGLILVDRRGRLADTVYSACCGGFGEANEHVWNTPPNPNLRGGLDLGGRALKRWARFAAGITGKNIHAWLKARPPCFCARSSFTRRGRFRWVQRYSQATLDRLVGRSHRLGRVLAIRVQARGRSGRATAVAIRGTRGRVVVTGELTIRRLFGNLKSAMFVVDRQPRADGGAAFVFRGGGWGHGVGMCQTGAIGMAEAGQRAAGILAHYYRGTRLVRLY